MSAFIVYPAIDLRSGSVVRLRQGDPSQQMKYSTRPGEVARRWRCVGAEWLHVVNLDGAFGEAGDANARALREILALGGKVQFGGGVRSLEAIAAALQLGVARVMLGTAAVRDPDLLARAAARFGGERLAVSMDLREGNLQIKGWKEGSRQDPVELGLLARELGIAQLVVTDVSRDGMGAGLNLELASSLAKASGMDVTAAGGAASLDDIRRARQAGLAGVVLGRALYEGSLKLEEALAC